ncbi:MAG: type 2 isopentenyl-diphosphate Delta-isomerase [Candidatus Diapherotrites archaeon]|nr:type 2 isopentenyl-diphosphate Delta-isomerase [Candidatus Diapherotrites archaeon]
MVSTTEQRKKEHLELCLTKDVAFKEKTTLLENIELHYNCLPEVSMNDVDLSTNFLGKKFDFPFLVSAITGGAQVTKKVNKDIAIACQETGIGMGLGSMRAMIEDSKLAKTYYVKDVAPDIFVAGNIGAAQIKEYSPQELNESINEIELDALAIHINAGQEAMQPEGDFDFSGVIDKIKLYAEEISVPIYVKEVGHGIGFEAATALKQTGIKAIDVQGAGGTSWMYIDALRKKNGMKDTFREFGLPTAVSIIEVKNALSGEKKIIGSGGIRTGIDAIKAIILGADLVGNAMPVLQAQNKSASKGVVKYLDKFRQEMEITAFLLGCKNIFDLKKQEYVVLGKLKEWLNQE